MQRIDLEHIIRAASDIVEQDVVVIGSQAVLAQHPKAPPDLLISVEAVLFPADEPERADEIDGAIGEGSMFHGMFDYYAHGVGPETPSAPLGWRERLVPLSTENTRGATGWCMEIHDLVLSKCVADREKDWEYARVAISGGLVSTQTLLDRVDLLPVDENDKQRILKRLRSLAAQHTD
jgi:uncharacterized nucleotidyltransferase DUF6036